jgi:chromate transporter
VDNGTLEELLFLFAPLSLASAGGSPAALAEMQHQAVAVHGWVTQRAFSDMFAISRVAPGSGSLLATLVGWEAAGWLGALVVTLAFFLPSSLLVFGAAHVWNRWRGSRWHNAVEAGFAPISVGLVFAGAYTMLQSGSTGLWAWATALSVAACRIWRPKVHPVLLFSAGAAMFVLARHMGGS